MKTCYKCKKLKPFSEFGKNPSKKDGYNSQCKSCMKIYKAVYYKKNKIALLKERQDYIQEKVKWLKGIKQNLKCACGENHPACLDFHHSNSKTKEFSIASKIRNYSKERILKEINKCIVLCSNCHRKLHWKEKNAGVA